MLRRTLIALLCLPALLLACPDGPAEGEGEAGEGEGEGEDGEAFAFVSATDVTPTSLVVAPGFAITARSDGRFVVAWFEQTDEVANCLLFNGDTVEGDVYRLMVGAEQGDGSVVVSAADAFVPNVKEDALDLAIDGQDRVLIAYQGGEVDDHFCGGSDLMLAVENGDGTFTSQTVASTADTGATCRGDAGGDPYCNRGGVVGLYPAIAVDGTDVAISYLDFHFGFGEDDISQSDLELARGTPGGTFTLSSINMESGGGYYDACAITGDGNVLIGHNVTANNAFDDGNGGSFVVEDGIYAEVVDGSGAVVHEAVVLPGVLTASRVTTASSSEGLFLAVHDRSDEQLFLFTSVDGGAQWRPSPIEQLGRSGRDPNLLFTDDGRLVAVYGHCRDNTNQDGCDAKTDGVRFALRSGSGSFSQKLTVDGDDEDIEAVGVDAVRAPGDQIVTVSLNATQNRLTVHRVQVN